MSAAAWNTGAGGWTQEEEEKKMVKVVARNVTREFDQRDNFVDAVLETAREAGVESFRVYVHCSDGSVDEVEKADAPVTLEGIELIRLEPSGKLA